MRRALATSFAARREGLLLPATLIALTLGGSTLWAQAADEVSRDGARAGVAPPLIERIRALRLAGKLGAASEQIELGLAQDHLQPRDEVALRLELAKIYDRVGLHTNTRPVAEALQEIERAAAVADGLDTGSRGAVEAALATYMYRAEMGERLFPRATAHAQRAIALLKEADDSRSESDAVHQLGLISLQRREFVRARELFDASLALDRETGERAWMLGEYHRHIAFIHVAASEWDAALPHFERSLEARKRAGAVDASLFAAISLGNVLIRIGDAEAAVPHLQYALRIAREIPSPVGTARAALGLGQSYEESGRLGPARAAYRAAVEAAAGASLESTASRAREALSRVER